MRDYPTLHLKYTILRVNDMNYLVVRKDMVKEQLVVRVNKHERLSNITLRHRLK